MCVYIYVYYLEGALLVLGGEEQHQGQGLGALWLWLKCGVVWCGVGGGLV